MVSHFGTTQEPKVPTTFGNEELVNHLHNYHSKHSLSKYQLRGWVDQQKPLLVGVPDRIPSATAHRIRWHKNTHTSDNAIQLDEIPTSKNPVPDNKLEQIVGRLTDVSLDVKKLTAEFANASPQLYIPDNDRYLSHRPNKHTITIENQTVNLQFNEVHRDFNHVYDDLMKSRSLKTTTKGFLGEIFKWGGLPVATMIGIYTGTYAEAFGLGVAASLGGKLLETQYYADSARQRCYELLGHEQVFEKSHTPLLITEAPHELVQETKQIYAEQTAA